MSLPLREEAKDLRRKQLSEPKASRGCPNCGGTLQKGYLVGQRGIYWSRNPPLYGFTCRGTSFLMGGDACQK